MLRATLLATIPALVLAAMAVAQEKKPPLPPGRDPGGVAVALIGGGIDYTLPDLARRLARDGEGELIGWDLVDGDNRPFERVRAGAPANEGDGTALARMILSEAEGVRLIAVRANPGEPASLARAVAFIAQTPARIAVIATTSGRREDWEPFRQAASHFKDILLIVPAGSAAGTGLVYPAALDLDNVLAVNHESGTFGALALASKAAVALLAREKGLNGALLKRRLLER